MTARVYVGTYAKYNSGSIAGQWLDLENYSTADDFIEACKALHKGEPDPELMFQDYEGFPKAFYNEGCIAVELWDWLELDEDDRELLEVYCDNIDADGTIEQAREKFTGKFDSEADWAEQWLDDSGALADVPEHLANYIDFEAYGRDARLGGDMCFIRHDGELWAFYNT